MAPDRRARAHLLGRRAPQRPWGLLLLGLATAVVAGILAMHGFSVGHQVPADASMHQVHTSTGNGAHHSPADSGDHPCPAPDCDEHGAMAAMCLFVLLWLMPLVPPRGGSPWRWQPPWLTSLVAQPLPAPRHLSRVSLIRLCISRT